MGYAKIKTGYAGGYFAACGHNHCLDRHCIKEYGKFKRRTSEQVVSQLRAELKGMPLVEEYTEDSAMLTIKWGKDAEPKNS